MEPDRHGARCRRCVALLALSLCATTAGLAEPDVPDGLAVGPWVLAPQASTEWEYQSNFFLTDKNSPDDPIISEQLLRVNGSLLAALPFKNSLFRVEQRSSRLNYKTLDFDQNFTQNSTVTLDLNFSSGDELRIRDSFRRDFVQVRQNLGGGDVIDPEAPFVGQPFNRNIAEIQLERNNRGSPGYEVRLRRLDLNYRGDVTVDLVEFHGYIPSVEYSQPISRRQKLLVFWAGRRLENYRVGDPLPGPFRTDKTDTYQLGLRSAFGRQPFFFRLGYVRLRYTGRQPSSFDGLSGRFVTQIDLGGRSSVELTAIRATLPSNFNTYYVNNAILARFDRDWFRSLTITADFGYVRNRYGQPIPQLVCDGLRDDQIMDGRVRARWRVHGLLQVRTSAGYAVRRSNCENRDYEGYELKAGLGLGW